VNGRARIFIVDDHPLVREYMAITINRESDLQTCGEAGAAPAAFQAITACRPDLVTVDLSLKDSSGLELLKDLRVRCPRLPVLVYTADEDAAVAARALRAGARGFVTKRSAGAELLTALRGVLAGGRYVPAALAGPLAAQLFPDHARRKAGQRLSDREAEVLALLRRGCTAGHIAAVLHLSTNTVHTYCQRLKDKFAVRNARELLVRACCQGCEDCPLRAARARATTR
jgi:DNA-binding NarL/FixJ family response regulator